MSRVAEPSAPRYTAALSAPEPGFAEVVGIIRQARAAAHQAVNTALIDLYWRVGGYISQKVESAAWGEGVVDQLAAHIAREHPDLKGYTRSHLFRMRQFYEAYRGMPIVAPLVRQLPWTHHLLILSRNFCFVGERYRLQVGPRDFYLKLSHERPSIGVLLCATRTTEVVEYALACSASPALVAEDAGS